ncbi:MAG: hypothetical protein J7M20_05695, partial [Deltaproteobacteria bacterium]|nr:hypothetical protein [Deltaproteobacteria bacterium]
RVPTDTANGHGLSLSRHPLLSLRGRNKVEPRDSRGPKAGLHLKIPRAGRVSVERVGRETG